MPTPSDRAPATEDVETLVDALHNTAMLYGYRNGRQDGSRPISEKEVLDARYALVAHLRESDAAFRAEREQRRRAEEALARQRERIDKARLEARQVCDRTEAALSYIALDNERAARAPDAGEDGPV